MRRLLKPWFVWRPRQLARRMDAAWASPRPGYTAIPVAWGVSVLADARKTIGRSIWTTGIHDLTVSEILARMVRPGDTVIDAGANVGYMTLLAAVAAGPSGRVLAWEPHPDLFLVLRENARLLSKEVRCADISVRGTALGETPGTASLVVPKEIEANDGLSYIGEGSGHPIAVPVETVDQSVGSERIAVLKLDVEGSELRVLAGADQALNAGRIMHIVFEDHAAPDSAVIRLLLSKGYEVFSAGWSLRGPKLGRWADERLAEAYEAPTYVATLAPDELRARCGPAGWLTLRASFARRWARVGVAGEEIERQCA